jgi:predicted protein tyrosine phosphatase
MNVLFVCSQNRLRSPTAEHLFADWPGVSTASAGTNLSAEQPLTPELVEWADLICVMEAEHRSRLRSRFREHLRDQRIVCLRIPDRYRYMQPELMELLLDRVSPHLP